MNVFATTESKTQGFWSDLCTFWSDLWTFLRCTMDRLMTQTLAIRMRSAWSMFRTGMTTVIWHESWRLKTAVQMSA